MSTLQKKRRADVAANGPRYGVTDEKGERLTRGVLAWFVHQSDAIAFGAIAGLHVWDLHEPQRRLL